MCGCRRDRSKLRAARQRARLSRVSSDGDSAHVLFSAAMIVKVRSVVGFKLAFLESGIVAPVPSYVTARDTVVVCAKGVGFCKRDKEK